MGVYDGPIQTAFRLIDRFGQTATWRKKTLVIDPSEPWKASSQTLDDTSVRMVFLPFRPDQVEGYAFQRGDELGYLAAQGLTFEPDEEDQVVRADGTLWAVIAVTKLAPGGDPVLYEMQVRQWPRRSQ